jgi:hypothetical protein
MDLKGEADTLNPRLFSSDILRASTYKDSNPLPIALNLKRTAT